jgi:hypothetical protein
MTREQPTRRAASVFIRFVIENLDPDSGRRQGLFQAGRELRLSGRLSRHDEARHQILLDWFDTHLEKPARLALSSRPGAKAQTISWFRDTASEHIKKMREFQQLLEEYGLAVEIIKCGRPGYIVYEDEFQVTAFPFNGTAA